MTDNISKFLEDIKEVCVKHNMCIGQGGIDGGFILTTYDDEDMHWLHQLRWYPRPHIEDTKIANARRSKSIDRVLELLKNIN